MKIKTLFFVLLPLVGGACFYYVHTSHASDKNRRNYEAFLVKLNKKAPHAEKEPGTGLAADEPGMAEYHDMLMTLDPATGRVPRERLRTAMETTQRLSSLKKAGSVLWQGYPSNMGGRTRAIMWDPNDPSHKKAWAAGVTGGLWYNNDVANASSSWIPVNDFWSNLALRCLAYDPAHPLTFYLGTGEAETALQTYRESSGLGTGIMRSSDGGQSWSFIPGTEQFAYVTDILVRIENNVSVIYAGVASGLYKGEMHQSNPSDGLFRSADNGATWQQVLPVIPGYGMPYCVSDIALGADNRLYVGTRPNLNGQGAAVIMYSDNGLQWTVNTQYQAEILADTGNNIPGRVVLATSPSDPNVVYALIANGFVNPVNGFNYFYCDYILRSADKGITWVKKTLPTDLTSGSNFATIAWHALDLAIDPNNPNTLYIGGLDVHKSTDGGNSWQRVSDWSLMTNGGGPQYIHADQHIIAYKPGSSNEILFGTDGGVFYTSNGAGGFPVFEEHNKGYTTLQFYTCAIHPDAGTVKYYGGLQDNGAVHYTGAPLTINDIVVGGDGACCFYDESDPDLAITSYYFNNYVIWHYGSFVNFTGSWSSGTFISPADLDYKNKYLFSNAVDYIGTRMDSIVRFGNLTSASNISAQFLNLNTGSTVFFSALRYSPYSPPGKSTLFIGSESGRLFRVNEAQGNSPVSSEIGSPSFPTGNISSIAIGGSEDTLMVTFSNFGVVSVWQTYNGGQTWTDVEGNLPDIPVRWALYHPSASRKALLATETGVWECGNLQGTPVDWQPVNEGMANVRTDMLVIRKADNMVLAATHGRGLFTMKWDVVSSNPEIDPSNARVYPNPSQGVINVSARPQRPGEIMLEVSNMRGEKVLTESYPADAGLFRKQVNLATLPKGIYFVSVKSGSQVLMTEKIILL